MLYFQSRFGGIFVIAVRATNKGLTYYSQQNLWEYNLYIATYHDN